MSQCRPLSGPGRVIDVEPAERHRPDVVAHGSLERVLRSAHIRRLAGASSFRA